jgi:Fic family protein
MFTPRYQITDQLLANITRINSLIRDLNDSRFPRVVLAELEKSAMAVSSYASTSIEGNPLPLTEVKQILKLRPENIRDSEKEVLNYNNALGTIHELYTANALDLSLRLILSIHRQVTSGLLPSYESGKLRKKPVVVNDPRSGKVVYLPPDFDQVESLMKDLVSFVHEHGTSINPLILAGVFHKQMVIIHPFMDGNGRTTRLATKILLAKIGLNTFNLFSFENYYNQNVTKYFQTVGEVGDYYEVVKNIDFTVWLEYFTEGVLDELLRVQKLLPAPATTPDSRLEVHHTRLMEYIRENGFINDRSYAKLTDRAKATRTQDFKKLVELGLIERKGGGRSTYYILREI